MGLNNKMKLKSKSLDRKFNSNIKFSNGMKKDKKLNTTAIAIILTIVLALWNTSLIEAKENFSSINADTKEEILWLARVVYSETKNSDEQVLVAWVVRNRVETEFRGETYKEVAKSSGQFSGLNISDAQYLHNISRDYDSSGESWEKALDIAEAVYFSPDFLRPFPKTVRHFYSPLSVSISPEWSADSKPVIVIRDSSEDRNIRFAFYDGVK